MFVRKRELYNPVVGPPNHLSIKKMPKVKKKLYLIRFTNFLITVHIMAGGKTLEDAQFSVTFPS